MDEKTEAQRTWVACQGHALAVESGLAAGCMILITLLGLAGLPDRDGCWKKHKAGEGTSAGRERQERKSLSVTEEHRLLLWSPSLFVGQKHVEPKDYLNLILITKGLLLQYRKWHLFGAFSLWLHQGRGCLGHHSVPAASSQPGKRSHFRDCWNSEFWRSCWRLSSGTLTC